MSNTLVIAAVTAMLKDILENRLANHPVAISIGDLLVTALPPDRITVGSDERPQLNVFLYQVSQNRNADWMKRESVREQKIDLICEVKSQYISPPSALALDLHYLITAYGAKDFQAELLLGYAMQVLHDIPLMTREMVYTALKHAAAMTTFGALSQILSTLSIEDLAEQIGSIKLCPEFFSMEETSKLWSSLQTPYRPSAGYQASMVLLNRYAPEQPKHPVIVQSHPTIERIESPNLGIIHPGDALIIHGHNLQNSFTYLRITRRVALLRPETVQDQQITLLLPTDIPAGIQSIQVIHLNPEHSGAQKMQSNLAAVVIQPFINLQVISLQPIPPNLYQIELTLTVKPLIVPDQQILLLFHPLSADLSPLQITVPCTDTPTDTLTLPIQITPSHYWVQLQVDGARSEAVELEVRS